MYLLVNINDPNDVVITKYRIWPNYKNLTCADIIKNGIFFHPDEHIQNMLSVNYRARFKEGIKIKKLENTIHEKEWPVVTNITNEWKNIWN